MRKRMKQFLAFLLISVLMLNGLSAMGPFVVKAAEVDNKVLNVKVVNENGEPVANVPLFLEADSEYGENVKLGKTDADGKYSYALQYEWDKYYLKPVATSGFSCEEPAVVFVGADEEWSSIIETVNGEPYTGEVVLVVTGEEIVTDPGITKFEIDSTIFPDDEFRRYILENIDTNEDGKLQDKEIEAATDIDFDYGTYWVMDLTGIECLENLESLNCAFNGITSLDLSANANLTYLDCSYNEELTSLDVTKNVKLEELHCYETPIEVLDVTNNTELVRLDCNKTNISTIDVSNCTKLFALNVEYTNLTSIDISKNTEIYETYISFTDIAEFDISNNPKMGQIRFEETKVTSMDFSKNPELACVRCSNTAIEELDFSNNPNMYEIYCFGTEIDTLDLANMPGLNAVECYNTKITSLDVTNNPELVGLACGNTGITVLDVTNNPELLRLECNDTQIKNLDLSNNKKLTSLNVSNTAIAEMEYFDASGFAALEELYCNNAGMKSLNLEENIALYSLDCGNNSLTSLDLSGVYLWYLNTVSPQAAETGAVLKDGKLVLDMGAVVPDITKVVIPESDAYAYNAKTGVVTFETVETAKLKYTYDHGNPYGVDPMEVTLSVYEVPAAVSSAKAVLSGGHNDVKFTWSDSVDADGYLVSYKKASAKTWSKAVDTTNLSYVKKDLAANTKYNFKVVPYKLYGEEKIYDNAQAKVVTITTKKNVKAPATMKVNLSGDYNDVKISWSKVSGADGYYVSMKKTGDTSFTRIAATTKLSFVKKNLADGVKYTFNVVPYYKKGDTKVKAFYSKTASITTLKKLSVPKVTKVSAKKVKVSWTNIEGETGYQISRSTKKAKTNIVNTFKTTTGKTKTLTVKKGTKYYYKVRAYKTVDGKKIYGPWSNVKAYTLK